MERRGVGKRLTDGQRVEILKLFESGAAVTEADVARRYGVTRSAIWRLRRAGDSILERYQEGDIESRDDRRRGASSASRAPAVANPGSVRVDNSMEGPVGEQAALAAMGMRAVMGDMGLGASGDLGLQVQAATSSSVAASNAVVAMREDAVPEQTDPLVFLSVKAIGSVQSPGTVNWERVGGALDEEHFEVVNDGIVVRREGGYQLNVDLQHSQPRQNFRFTFKVWHGKKLLGQCACPLRTKKEVSLSVLELRCRLPALAKLRVEFLAPGFAFHESRATIRLLP